MKIVHVTDSYLPKVGGIERQVERLARQQRAAGHDVRIVTAASGSGSCDQQLTYARSSQLRTALSPLELRRLSSIALDGGETDLVHSHVSVISPLPVHAARRASKIGVPIAVTVHSFWPTRPVGSVVLSPNLVYGSASIRATWSSVSSAAAHSVLKALRGRHDVSIVPNIVDTAWWSRRELTPVARSTGSDEVSVVCVGRLAGRKRVLPLLEMIAAVRGRVPERALRVSIVGDGPRREEVDQVIGRLKLGDSVQVLGECTSTEIRRLLHSADLFLAPARRESFGIAALEARAAGVPVVGFRGTGLADFIADGVEGVLVDTDAGMIDAISGLVTNPARLAHLQTYARTRPPSISAADAMRALDQLYERAFASSHGAQRQSVHGAGRR